MTKEERNLSILLGSSMKRIDQVSDEATMFLEKYELKKHVFPVCLVLREGLSNAVRHAHKLNPEKIIKFIIMSFILLHLKVANLKITVFFRLMILVYEDGSFL